MPLQPNDEKLYRAVINLQVNEDFEVVKAYIRRRHAEESGKYSILVEDHKLRWSQGRAQELADLFNKFNPNFANNELEKLEKRARESEAGKNLSKG